jgi:hypothetical protein
MANKKPKAAWEEAKQLYELGYDLVSIAKRTKIAKTTISGKAREQGWAKDVHPKHGINTSICDLEALIGDLSYFALTLPKEKLQEHRDLSVIITNHMASRERMLNQAEALPVLQIIEGAQMALEWIREHCQQEGTPQVIKLLDECHEAHRQKLAELGR